MNIIYDFDKTLTYKDTYLPFLLYSSRSFSVSPFIYLQIILCVIRLKTSLISNDQYKSITFGLIFKNKTRNEINEVAKNFVSQNHDIFNKLGHKIKGIQNENVFVVTASPECYVTLFLRNIKVIGTKLAFDDSDVYSHIELNCFGSNKIKALNQEDILHIDEFYTDSYSDMPLILRSKNSFLVSGDKITSIDL